MGDDRGADAMASRSARATRTVGRLALVVILVGVILTVSIWFAVIGLPLLAIGVLTWRGAVRSLDIGRWPMGHRIPLVVMAAVGAVFFVWLTVWAIQERFSFSSTWSYIGFFAAAAWTTLALWATRVILSEAPL